MIFKMRNTSLKKFTNVSHKIKMYDLIIIGGGVAGFTATIYSARKKLNTFLVYKKLGGQTAQTGEIHNWPGTKNILGPELAQNLEEHAKSYGVEIKSDATITKIAPQDNSFILETDTGDKFEAKTVLIAAGKTPRRISAENSEKFEGKGIAYCSICDAPLFSGKDVAVVGGGNSGLEAALDLEKYANKVYLLEGTGKLNGDAVLIDKIKHLPKISLLLNTEITKIDGANWIEKITYQEKTNGQNIKELNISGIFVEIGYIPATDFIKDIVKLNEKGEIVIDSETNETNIKGIFAAGDITDIPFKQIVIAAGEGAKAALNIEKYLQGSPKVFKNV